MKKRIVWLGLLITILIMSVGCSKTVSNEQIEKDLKDIDNIQIVSKSEKIKKINVIEKITDKENGETVVNCIIVTEDDECSYEKEVELTYSLDDDNENDLESVSVEDKSEWLIKPIKGVSKQKILDSLYDVTVKSNGEDWYVNKENISSFSVIKQETDLKNNKDIVSVSLQIEDIIQLAEGELKFEYSFEDKWILKAVTGNDDFKSSVKPGKDFKASKEKLINDLDQKNIVFGKNGVLTQSLLVNKSEISELSIINESSFDKGTRITYECTVTLNKSLATFTINAKMEYCYDGTWNLSNYTLEAKCNSVSIIGAWKGSNVYGRIVQMTIDSLDESGNVVGVYSDKGNQYYDPYSYNVSGTIDYNTLIIYLEAGELIGEKPYWAFEATDIKAYIRLNDNVITGNADLQFTVSK